MNKQTRYLALYVYLWGLEILLKILLYDVLEENQGQTIVRSVDPSMLFPFLYLAFISYIFDGWSSCSNSQ